MVDSNDKLDQNLIRRNSHDTDSVESNNEERLTKRPWSSPIDYNYLPDLACIPDGYDE